jgi:hypothetical protein
VRAGFLRLASMAAALAWAGAAAADEPGLGNAVYTPYVKKGITEVEVRGGRLLGGQETGDSGVVVELERGVSDRLSLALVGEFEDEPGDRRKLDSVGLEAVAYLGQIPGTGVDVGGYLEYEQRIHNESGVVEGKILLARRFGPVQGLLNLIAQQPLTNRQGEGATRFGYAAQATVDVGDNVRVGLQGFGELGTNRSFGGRQGHFAGPVMNWEIHPRWARGELELQAAYLAPLGTARHDTDGQVRFGLEWETRF